MHDLDRTQPDYHQHHNGLHHGHCGHGQCGGEHHHHHHQGGIHFPDVPIHGHDDDPGDTHMTAGHDPAAHEALEMELASELLEVTNEQELDHFLGDLINKVGKGIGNFVHSPIGKALGGVLKSAAKTALPIAGSALGTLVGGPAGGMIGGKLASAAGNMFGLELEGLSPEDREFEAARGFVRLASEATRLAEMHEYHHHWGRHPRRAARSAFFTAARRFGPGFLRPHYHHHMRPFHPQYSPAPEPPVVAVPDIALEPVADSDDGDSGQLGEMDMLGYHPSAPHLAGLHSSASRLAGLHPSAPHLGGQQIPPPHLTGMHPAPPHLAGQHPLAPPVHQGPAPTMPGHQVPAPPIPGHQGTAPPIPGHQGTAPPVPGHQGTAPPMPGYDVFATPTSGQHANGSQHHGRWIRKGRRIILFGV